jgi:serine phosphatase RsbU (regulator of sigma subunit)/anti-sigma regulatory factor (Ser/Thr protein kinase)
VRAVVVESGLSEVLDEALLLTTELATNAVVHARTELDVEIVSDADGLTVTVMDFRSGPITHSRRADVANGSAGPPERLDDGGRGLLLVDKLATYWGSLHYPHGKGVWFRLERKPAAQPLRGTQPPPSPSRHHPHDGVRPTNLTMIAERPPAPARGDAATVTAEVLDLLVLRGRPAESGNLADLEQLLAGMSQAVDSAGAAIILDQGDGGGTRTVAEFGEPVPSVGGVRVPLRLIRPWRGELVLVGPSAAYVPALVDLTAERVALTLENERLRGTDSERRTWLTYLAEVGELLAQSLDADLTLALIPRLVVPRLGRWCAVHVADGKGGLRLAALAHADESAIPLLHELLAEALPQLNEARELDAVVPLPAPTDGYAVSMSARGQQLGVLSVGYDGHRRLGSEELAVVEDVARRAALAIDNARIHAERRAVAAALQHSLLPPTLPTVDGMDFGAEYVPAGEGVDVGGDFYDVMALPDGAWLVVVGDVSGKGVHAATVTGLVRDATRVLVRDGRPLPETLSRLNETLVERGAGRFCTLVLAAVSRRSGGRLDVSLYLAGHDKPVLLTADGGASQVGECGTALGLLSQVSTPVFRLTLGPGDTLIFYTDGVTERRCGADLYGVERLRREASTLAGFPASVVAARLRAATLNFSTEAPRDDIAILALRNDAGT